MKKKKAEVITNYDSLWDTFTKHRESWTTKEEELYIAWDEDMRHAVHQAYLESLMFLYKDIEGGGFPPSERLINQLNVVMKYRELLDTLGEEL